MSDIEMGERFFRYTTIGNVQAFAEEQGGASVVMGWTAETKNAETRTSWSSHGLYLSAADARALAAALIAGAEFAETVATAAPAQEEVAA